jgi:ubiquinone biosynthesis protein COQ9
MSKRPEDRLVQKDKILQAILPHVAFDGWTDAAMESGARDFGVNKSKIDRLFPGGAREIVGHFGDWADREMLAALGELDLVSMKLRDRVSLAVRVRLSALSPHREAVRRTFSYLSLPSNVTVGVRTLYNTVDSIWYKAGDKSTDFSFYTKRALLAGVISATILFWIGDESEDSVDSWAFLDRRIADVMKIPALRNRFEKIACSAPDLFKILRTLRTR